MRLIHMYRFSPVHSTLAPLTLTPTTASDFTLTLSTPISNWAWAGDPTPICKPPLCLPVCPDILSVNGIISDFNDLTALSWKSDLDVTRTAKPHDKSNGYPFSRKPHGIGQQYTSSAMDCVFCYSTRVVLPWLGLKPTQSWTTATFTAEPSQERLGKPRGSAGLDRLRGLKLHHLPRNF
ncbi:hypothetical protein BDN72DRAFT_941909 [Pluteus cervinus]|uniref:Uncharacterized protein n=1 Tax=Pluteus cervinus TaxID=181527 RepID=A0ACD3A2C4_9AGAR|nr:hypothetical protein BDN72DRAFT_941909 [Pluteus cervinus]